MFFCCFGILLLLLAMLGIEPRALRRIDILSLSYTSFPGNSLLQAGALEIILVHVVNWRGGSRVKSADFPSRAPRFNPRHPDRSLQPSATLVPGDPPPLHKYICRQNNNVHEIKIFLKKK